MSVAFEDFRLLAESAGGFPRSVSIDIPPRGLEIEIKWKDVDVNIDLPKDLFSITPPPGVVPERLNSPPIPLAPTAAPKGGG